MALVAVVDAQSKDKTSSTDDIVNKSPWWKRFKKVSKDM
jgi:malate dehydrogenase (oxaloacetate-decarboxylating)(NADP+)